MCYYPNSDPYVLVEEPALSTLADLCDGDARCALNGLQLAVEARRSNYLHQRSEHLLEITAEDDKALDVSREKSTSALGSVRDRLHLPDCDIINRKVPFTDHHDSNDPTQSAPICSTFNSIAPSLLTVTVEYAKESLQRSHLLYDRAGEEHYNIISALHKSMRGSDANASLYWLARMLCAGEDPLYVARRIVRFASEDIGKEVYTFTFTVHLLLNVKVYVIV